MAYCALSDVQALLPKFTLSATTKPNQTQVTQFLDDVTAEIDIYLARGGVGTPVTTPTTFVTWLRKVCQTGVAAMTLKAMFPDQVGPAETPAYAYFEKQYRDALKLMLDGDFISSIIGASSDLMDVSTYFTRNPDEEEELGEIAEPLFKIGKEF